MVTFKNVDSTWDSRVQSKESDTKWFKEHSRYNGNPSDDPLQDLEDVVKIDHQMHMEEPDDLEFIKRVTLQAIDANRQLFNALSD